MCLQTKYVLTSGQRRNRDGILAERFEMVKVSVNPAQTSKTEVLQTSSAVEVNLGYGRESS